MDIRGVFLHFNTECLRQAEDIQSFVDGPRLVDCKKETYAEILLRHVDRNLIPLEERSTYNSMNSAKAKTFRVVNWRSPQQTGSDRRHHKQGARTT